MLHPNHTCDPRDFGFKLLCEVDWSIIMLRGRVSFLPPRSAVPSSCSSCGMLDRRRTLSEMDAIISCLSSSLSESTLSRLGWLRSARSSAGEQALPGGDTMGDPVEVVAILPKRAVPYECRARRERRCTSRTPVTCVLMRARRLNTTHTPGLQHSTTRRHQGCTLGAEVSNTAMI